MVAGNDPYQHLLLPHGDGVAQVTLNWPEVHNAFNACLIAELAVWAFLEKLAPAWHTGG